MTEKKLIIGSISDGLEKSLFSYIVRNHNGIEPLYIITPSNLCSLFLSRRLLRAIPSHSNVRFTLLVDIAKILTTDYILKTGLREMPPLFEDILAISIVNRINQAGYFRGVMEFGGFPDALTNTFRDLIQADIDDLTPYVENINLPLSVKIKLGELSTIYRQFRESIESYKFYTDDDLIKMSGNIKNISDILETDIIALYGLYDFNFIQWRFIENLSDQLNTTIFFPYRDSIMQFAKKTITQLKEIGFEEERIIVKKPSTPLCAFQTNWDSGKKVEESPAVKILSCFLPSKEIEEITRCVISLSKKGVPLYEMAVILLKPEPYVNLLISTLKRAEIPYYIPGGVNQTFHSSIRSSLLLLDLIGSELPRDKTIDFLQYAPIPYENIINKSGVEYTQFNKISMQAGIIEGREQWIENLDNFIKTIQITEESPYIKRVIETAESLKEIVINLSYDLGRFPPESTLSQYLEIFTEIVKKYISSNNEFEIVEKLDNTLGRSEFFSEKIKLSQFKRLVHKVIGGIRKKSGRFQRDGLNILSAMEARGMRFKVVFIPGLSEDKFPASGKQDPLILDFEREKINEVYEGYLPIKSNLPEEDLLLLSMAIDSATDALYFTYPRYTGITENETFPSYYIASMIQSLQGRKPSYSELTTGENVSDRFFEFIPCGVEYRGEFIDIEEADRKYITIASRENNIKKISSMISDKLFPFFRKGLNQAFYLYQDKCFNIYSGLILNPALKRDIWDSISKAGLSPTLLQDYTLCPFSFLVKRVLRVKTLREPEERYTLDPPTIGSIIHNILKIIYEEAINDKEFRSLKDLSGFDDLIQRTTTDRLNVIIKTIPKDYRPFIEEETDALHTLIKEAISHDIVEDSDWRPIHLEKSFGLGEGEDVISTEPVAIEMAEGLSVNISGKIDRIDEDIRGEVLRLIDYKVTTQPRKYDINSLTLSNGLQVFFYTLFASKFFSDYQRHKFEFRTIDRKSKTVKPFCISFRDIEKSREEIQNDLKNIINMMKDGVFIPVNDDDKEKCRYCEYSEVCPFRDNIVNTIKKNEEIYKQIVERVSRQIFHTTDE